MCVCVWMCAHACRCLEGPEASDPLELEMGSCEFPTGREGEALETVFRSSAKAVYANH